MTTLAVVVHLDHAWVADVVGACDPVFDAADVGFVHQLGYGDEHRRTVVSLLWEADPRRFADRYPESGIVESYGEDQWPGVHCIDFWVHLEPEAGRCRLSVEGWNLPELFIELRGIGAVDGASLADTFARILGVTSPRVRPSSRFPSQGDPSAVGRGGTTSRHEPPWSQAVE